MDRGTEYGVHVCFDELCAEGSCKGLNTEDGGMGARRE